MVTADIVLQQDTDPVMERAEMDETGNPQYRMVHKFLLKRPSSFTHNKETREEVDGGEIIDTLIEKCSDDESDHFELEEGENWLRLLRRERGHHSIFDDTQDFTQDNDSLVYPSILSLSSIGGIAISHDCFICIDAVEPSLLAIKDMRPITQSLDGEDFVDNNGDGDEGISHLQLGIARMDKGVSIWEALPRRHLCILRPGDRICTSLDLSTNSGGGVILEYQYSPKVTTKRRSEESQKVSLGLLTQPMEDDDNDSDDDNKSDLNETHTQASSVQNRMTSCAGDILPLDREEAHVCHKGEDSDYDSDKTLELTQTQLVTGPRAQYAAESQSNKSTKPINEEDNDEEPDIPEALVICDTGKQKENQDGVSSPEKQNREDHDMRDQNLPDDVGENIPIEASKTILQESEASICSQKLQQDTILRENKKIDLSKPLPEEIQGDGTSARGTVDDNVGQPRLLSSKNAALELHAAENQPESAITLTPTLLNRSQDILTAAGSEDISMSMLRETGEETPGSHAIPEQIDDDSELTDIDQPGSKTIIAEPAEAAEKKVMYHMDDADSEITDIDIPPTIQETIRHTKTHEELKDDTSPVNDDASAEVAEPITLTGSQNSLSLDQRKNNYDVRDVTSKDGILAHESDAVEQKVKNSTVNQKLNPDPIEYIVAEKVGLIQDIDNSKNAIEEKQHDGSSIENSTVFHPNLKSLQPVNDGVTREDKTETKPDLREEALNDQHDVLNKGEDRSVPEITREREAENSSVVSMTKNNDSGDDPVCDMVENMNEEPIGKSTRTSKRNRGELDNDHSLKEEGITSEKKPRRAKGKTITPSSPHCSKRNKVEAKSSRKRTRGSPIEHGIPNEEDPILVLATGVEMTQKHKTMIKRIGGLFLEKAQDAARATHVIAASSEVRLKRTPKLMVALCSTENIVHLDWLEKSCAKQKVLPTRSFLLFNEVEAEDSYRFNMRKTLQRAKRMRARGETLLGGFGVFLCSGVAGSKTPGNRTPPVQEFHLILEAAGANVLKALPTKVTTPKSTLIIVSNIDREANKQLANKKVGAALERGALVKSTDEIFHAIMTQEANFSDLDDS